MESKIKNIIRHAEWPKVGATNRAVRNVRLSRTTLRDTEFEKRKRTIPIDGFTGELPVVRIPQYASVYLSTFRQPGRLRRRAIVL